MNAFLKETDVDVIHMLNNTNPDAKESFLRSGGSLKRPENAYDNLDIERVRRNLKLLGEKLSDGNLPSGFTGEVYRYLLKNNLLKNQFVETNFRILNGERSEEIMREHRALNEELYGVPDEKTFCAILQNKLRIIGERQKNDEEKHLYDKLLSVTEPFADKAPAVIFRPSEEAFRFFSDRVEEFYAPILEHIPKDKNEFTIGEACEIANRILEEDFSATEEGWSAIVEKGGSIAHVSPEKRMVYFPEKRSRGNYTKEELRAILVHEVGTHTLRCLTFARHGLSALSTGMPGYEAFEEGVAKAVDQAINRKIEDVGQMHYLSLGFIYFGGFSFREVFDTQCMLERLSGGEPEGRCFDTTQRAFRGTMILPNNKDLVYFNGFQKVWEYIDKHIDDPELFESLFLSGKTDITRKWQEEAVYMAKTGAL